MGGDASFDDQYTPAVAAQAYAAIGWRIFPVHGIDTDGRCTCGKPACGGKHPITAQGFKDASSDPERIHAWWGRHPDANVGIPTGPASGLLVIDIDEGKGWESADRLEADGDLFSSTRVVKTGGGGLHLYFHYPEGMTIRNSTGNLAPGIDVRAAGGYVIAPPSLHRSGNRYTWGRLDGLDGGDGEIAPAPGWLLERLRDRPPSYQSSQRAQRTSFAPHEGAIPEGERNGTLASKAGWMRRYGFSEGEILAALAQMNADRCRPPLPESEVARIAKSVTRYAPAQGAGVGLVELPGGVTVRGLRRRAS